MELYKFLQQQGFGSRKVCRQLIEYGLVEIEGRRIVDPACPVDPAILASILVDGEHWKPLALPLYLVLNKPTGVETSHQPMHHPSVFSLLPRQFLQLGISAVGRLDADTTGLLLLSSDGQFVHALTSPRRHVAKRYRVLLKHAVNQAFLDSLHTGVVLHDDSRPVLADALEQRDDTTIALTISQGRYHQVKRMVAAAGNRVVSLHREAVGALELGTLAAGEWRHLTLEEKQSLGF
jgi:16S rRNA pseudouridine516 synthase